MQFKCQKQFYFKQFNLEYVHSLVLFDPLIKLYQVLPLRARVYLGAMAWRGNPYPPKLKYYCNLIIRLFNVTSRILDGEVLLHCSDAVNVFYSPSRLGQQVEGEFTEEINFTGRRISGKNFIRVSEHGSYIQNSSCLRKVFFYVESF